MRLLALSLFAAGSPWTIEHPEGRWAKSTAELAAELLPPEWASDAVTHTLGMPITQGGQPTSAKFTGREHETADGFCSRNTYYVSIYTEGGEARPQPAISGNDIRLNDCGGIFAHVNPGASLDGSKKALRWLEWARKIAASDAPLPFALSCRDEFRKDRCTDARKELAQLPVGKAFIVSKWSSKPHEWQFAVTETEPGQLLWDVKVDASPEKPSIEMVWKIPAPF